MPVQPDDTGLSRILDFTPEDLAANRAGKISPRQTQRWEANRQASLERLARGPGMTPYLMVLVYLLVLGGVGVAFFMFGGLQTMQAALGPLALPALAALALVLLAFVALIPFQYARSLGKEQARLASAPPADSVPVQVAAGTLKTRSGYNDNTGVRWYEVHVGGKTFSVSKALMEAFRNGKSYRVYFQADGRRLHLLSAEQTDS